MHHETRAMQCVASRRIRARLVTRIKGGEGPVHYLAMHCQVTLKGAALESLKGAASRNALRPIRPKDASGSKTAVSAALAPPWGAASWQCIASQGRRP